jgi:hypothetical protein
MMSSGPRIVPDGTGIEWRRSGGVLQHRYAAELFPATERPGPWITTEGVQDIVHPLRLAAIAKVDEE